MTLGISAVVIRELELDRPVLCGWSYGPLVILDYIRLSGEERIGGIHFVGAVEARQQSGRGGALAGAPCPPARAILE